ncbi:MAG TPA: hypothetical protein VMV29_22545, partial [Ktedonobacterales bacterium]|nr:hypothetical protein [Ktedonobacterales bacterium]
MDRAQWRLAQPGACGALTTRQPPRVLVVVGVVACLAALLAGCGGAAAPSGGPPGKAVVTNVIGAKEAVTFDPSVGAPLPDNRIVAAYGIDGGSQVNGPASTLDMLTAFLPQLQQLGQQYAALDPTHPVILGVDLVVNSIQP